MPIVWDNESTGTQRTSLQDFAPPLGYTVSKAVGATWADNPITRAYQWGGNLLQNDGEKLDAGAIDSLIKSAGVTDFTLPEGQYSKDAAMSLIERRRQQQIAADVDARTAWDYTYGTPIRALARTATMLADPLNMAAMFVPGLGEEWAAARAAGGASQFTTRALQGASQGAAGMSALEAVNYPLAQQLHDDYKSTDSLTNILTGAVLGGALHGAFGRVKGAEAPVPPDVAAVDEAAARTAVAQTVQDHPVSVDHLNAETLSGKPVGDWRTLTDDMIAAREQQQRTDDAYSQMTHEQLLAALDNGVAENRRIDRDVVRKNMGESGVAEYDALQSPRARDRFMEKADPEQLAAMQGVDTDRINEYISAQHNFDTESPAELGRSLLLAAKDMDGPRFIGSPEYVTMRNAFDFARAQGWDLDAVTAGLRGRMAELYGRDAPEVFERVFRRKAGDVKPPDIYQMRDAITANRERNILDGDGQPAREEPKAASEPEGRVQDAQARATAAAQEAEATVRALQERMSGEPAGEVKSPVMEAADAQVAKADAQAKALTDIVNCQRVQ